MSIETTAIFVEEAVEEEGDEVVLLYEENLILPELPEDSEVNSDEEDSDLEIEDSLQIDFDSEGLSTNTKMLAKKIADQSKRELLKNNYIYSKADFKKLPTEFKIGAVMSDGMWWTPEKLAKHSVTTLEETQDWIERNSSYLTQSLTGAKSFRMPYEKIFQWRSENDVPVNAQVVEGIFAPRVWDGETETESFLKAPLRELATVKFKASYKAVQAVKKELRGCARVTEERPGEYRATGLSGSFLKSIITATIQSVEGPQAKLEVQTRSVSHRREVVDFTQQFLQGFLPFYTSFSYITLKGFMETILIFLPQREERDSQVTYWVIQAIEKFNEKKAVPFSGYLDTYLPWRPQDLPVEHLGEELAKFQRTRSRAIKELKKVQPIVYGEKYPDELVAATMGVGLDYYREYEEKNRNWIASRRISSLHWKGTSDEKTYRAKEIGGGGEGAQDVDLASTISRALLETAIELQDVDEFYKILPYIDSGEAISTLSIGGYDPKSSERKSLKVSEPFKDKLLEKIIHIRKMKNYSQDWL